MNHHTIIKPTPQGIETLVQRLPLAHGKSLILRAQRGSFPEVFKLSDDKEELTVILLSRARQVIAESLDGSENQTYFYLLIDGIVESSAMRAFPNETPLVIIANAKVISAGIGEEAAEHGTKTQYKLPKPSGRLKIQGGHFPVFLKEWVPFLSNEELAGSHAWGRTFFPYNPIQDHNETVSAFLEHHGAIRTLHRSTNNGVVASGGLATDTVTGTYLSAIREFAAAQMDRQKASLTSNAGRESAEVAAKVAEQHKKALEYALTCGDELSVDLLCKWHGILCGEGLRVDAGELRKNKVHVGMTMFRPPERIRGDLEIVCTAIRMLEVRLLRNTASEDKALNAAILAAAVFMGIVDVHAFADGNGRLARIAVNWALHRAGIPFVIHLFATPVQRTEYVTAIKRTRQNVFLVCKGVVTQDQMLEAYRTCGALLPFVAFILSRLQRTVVEFGKVAKDKASLITEEEQARAARLYREREAEGNCMICFEAKPNIATLCCGKAIHLNCMAEWLSQQNSCPQCRNEMPRLPESMRPRSAEENDNTETSVDESTSETLIVETLDLDETSTSSEPIVLPRIIFSENEREENDTTSMDEDDTTEDEPAVQIPHPNSDDNASTNDTEEEDDDTTEVVPPAPQQTQHVPPKCSISHCNNRSARDCENHCCGPCCVMHGYYSCSRHNT